MKKLLINGSITLTGAALIGAMLVLAFAACPADVDNKPSDKAILNSVQAVAGDLAVNGELGNAISLSKWNELTGKDGLTGDETGALDFDGTPGPVVVTFKASASPKAAVTYAVARGNLLPEAGDFRALSEPVPPLADSYALYFKVVSENKNVTNYYYVEVTGVTGNAPSSNTGISGVRIGDGDAVTPSGSAVIGDVTLANYDLPGANMAGVVTLQISRPTGANADQTISWAKIGAAAVPTDADFIEFATPASGALSATVSSNGLATGDRVYIKVVASDGITKRFYGFTISAGNVARLASLSIADTELTRWGEPGTAWDSIAGAGVFNYQDDPPAVGFTLTASAADGGTAAYAVTADSAATPSFTNLTTGTANVPLVNGIILYIKVTSASGSVDAFYKIDIYLKASVKVLYGQPVISTSAGGIGSVPVIDSLWNTQNWMFYMNRHNEAEGELDPEKSRFLHAQDGYYDEIGYGHTEGRVKAFWDDGGLYVYAEMTFHDYTQWNPTAPAYPVDRVTYVTPGTVSDAEAHLYDSLEIFTNERAQQHTSGDHGVQYRVAPSPEGASAAASNSRVSGNNPSAIDTFRNNGKYYTWIRKDAEEKELGYSIIAYIPWAFKADANANQVFGADGKVSTKGDAAGPAIGMELQINAVTYDEEAIGVEARERAVLAWNGIGKPFQQVGNYGKITLITGNLTARGITRGAKD